MSESKHGPDATSDDESAAIARIIARLRVRTHLRAGDAAPIGTGQGPQASPPAPAPK